MIRVAMAATAADLGSFLVLVTVVGPDAEANPLIRAAIVSGLLGAVIAAKALLVVCLGLWPRTGWRYRAPVAWAGTLVGLLGFGSNVWAVR